MSSIDLLLDEENELTFQLNIEGSSPSSANCRLIVENKNIKTTNINILLNRIRLEKKSKSKKKIIYSALIICILSFISLISSNS